MLSSLTLVAPRSSSVGPRPIVYMERRMTVIRKARMPPRLGRMKSIDVVMATATHSKTDIKGGRTPTRHKKTNQFTVAY